VPHETLRFSGLSSWCSELGAAGFSITLVARPRASPSICASMSSDADLLASSDVIGRIVDTAEIVYFANVERRTGNVADGVEEHAVDALASRARRPTLEMRLTAHERLPAAQQLLHALALRRHVLVSA